MEETGFLHDPCVYINLLQDNLRNRYANGFPILKELVQNADDAGARVLHLGWTRGLPGSAHPLLQGPAIFAVNDGPFRPEDARAIRCLGLNTKAGDRGSIGKFGLGLKSVFHLCEAFFFLSAGADSAGGTAPPFRSGILNPWSGPAESSLSFHKGWNHFPSEEQEKIRLHLSPLLGGESWFCLWVPLRRESHRDGCDPIVEEYPGDQPAPPDWLTDRERGFDLAGLLPLLKTLAEVTIWAPWEAGCSPRFAVRLTPASGRRAFDGTAPLPGPLPFDGTVEVRQSTGAAVPVRYSGIEGWVPALEAMRKLAGWPKSFSLNRLTQQPERVPEKADPHCAVTLFGWPEPAGGLGLTKAVFLPLTRTAKRHPCPGPEHFRLVLHGYFFVDAGRGDVETTAHGGVEGEGQLRSRWNDELWRAGTLPLLLPCLKRFCAWAALPPEAVRELTLALRDSDLFRAHRRDVCAAGEWVYRLRPGGGSWELESGDSLALDIPEPPADAPLLPFESFLELAAIAEERVITFERAPRLAAADAGAPWPAALLERLLRGPVQGLLAEPARLDYAGRLLRSCLPAAKDREPVLGALCSFARALCRSLSPRVPAERAEVARRILREVPAGRRRKLPIPSSQLGEAAWQVLAAIEGETVLYPEAFEPEDRPGEAKLPFAEADALLRALAGGRYAEIRMQGVDNLRERLAIEVVLRASEEAAPLIQASAEYRLFRERPLGVAGREPALLSVRDLLERKRQQTLFIPTAENAAAALQRALPGERITLIDRDTFAALFAKQPLSVCDTPACVQLLARRPALAPPRDRADLLRALLQKAGGEFDAYRKAVRYLLHGDPASYDDVGPLLAPAGDADPLWERLCQECLARLNASWRVVPPALVPNLSEQQRGSFGVEPLGPNAAMRLLLKLPEEELGRLDLRPGRAEYKRLLEAFQEDGHRAVLRTLPIHADSAGRHHAFRGDTYWEGTFPVEGTSLAGHLLVLPLCADDEVLRALQLRLAPGRVLDAPQALAYLLRQDDLAPHWHVTLEALARTDGLPAGAADRLRCSAWLPSRNGTPPVKPEDVIYLPGLEDDVARVVENSAGVFFDARALAEEVRNQPGFQNLTRWVFPPPATALNMLGQLVADREDYWIGRADVPLPLGEFMEAFAPLQDTRVPACALFRRVTAVRSRGEVLENLVPELQRGELSVERLRVLLGELTRQHRERSADPEAVWRVYCWYLRVLARHEAFGRLLPELLLLSRAGQWRPPDRLSPGAEGISDADQLHPDLWDILQHRLTVRGTTPATSGPLADAPSPTLDRSPLPERFARTAKRLRCYFAPWEEWVPREVVGGFLSLLGDDEGVRRLAQELLGQKFTLAQRRQDLRFGLGDLDIHDAVAHLRADVRIIEESQVDVPNLVGGTFQAAVSTSFDHLLIDESRVKPIPREYHDGGGRTLFVDRIRLRACDPAAVVRQHGRGKLLDLLRRSACRIAAEIYNQSPATETLEAFFGVLERSDQRDISLAQRVQLERAADYLSGQLGLRSHPALGPLVKLWDQARRRQLEEEEASQRGTPLVGEGAEAMRRRVREQLRAVFESGGPARDDILAAVRRKIRDDFQYAETSVPFELFQNADDAYVEADYLRPEGAGPTGDAPWFGVCAEAGALVFLHAGRPINQYASGAVSRTDLGFDQDLEKMLVLSASDKAGAEASRPVTGKFGLGFKSVFLISDTPRVLSGRLPFEIVGGMYPRWWGGADGRLGPHLGAAKLPEGRATAVDLTLKDGTPPAAVLARFEQLLPVLLAFGRRIRRATLWQPGAEPRTYAWAGQEVAGLGGSSVGRLDGPTRTDWAGAAALRLGLGEGTFLLRLSGDGLAPFPADVPTVWVTAPTEECADLGFAVSGPFALDVGRAQLARASAENTRLAEEMGAALGQALIGVFRAGVGKGWPVLRDALLLARDADPVAFWESCWQLLGVQYLSRAERADTVVRELLERLVWGHGALGAATLYAEEQALPSGLAPRTYRVLTRAGAVRAVTAGALDEQPRLFEQVAGWESFQRTHAPGMLVSASRVWRVLQRLAPALCRQAVAEVRLADAVAGALGPAEAAPPEAAARLGAVIDRPLLDRLGEGADRQRLLDVLGRVQFLAQDRRYRPARDLLSEQAAGGDGTDESLRAGFAPPERLLSREYAGPALAFFLACRRQMEAKLEEMAEWALRADAESKRRRVVEYLLRGERRIELAFTIAEKGSEGTWLGFLSPDWEDYPEDQKYYGYLHSEQWRRKCEAVRVRSGGVCEHCRRRPVQEVHHRRYTSLYAEPLDDLLGLCAVCHTELHKREVVRSAGTRPPDPGAAYRSWLKEAFPHHQSALLRLLGLNRRGGFLPPEEAVAPAPVPDGGAVLRAIHEWWQAERRQWLPVYDRLVYPRVGPPEIRADGINGREDRKGWLTLFLLGLLHTMGRQRDEQHRSFLELCHRRGWLDVFADESSTADDWLRIIDGFFEEQAEEVVFYQWVKQFAGIRVLARRLDGYVTIFREVGRMQEDFPLTALTRPRTSAQLQGWGPDAPPVSRVLGIGACFVVRELLRRRVVEDNPFAHPHCYVPVRSTRDLLARLGCAEVRGHGGHPWDTSRVIHRFLRGHLGERANFLGDFDVPLLLVSRRPELQHRFLAAPLPPDGAEDELIFAAEPLQ